MYAIVKTGGKQYTVRPGDVFDVEKLPGQPGDVVSLPVLLLNDGSGIVTDAEALANVVVAAQIVEQHKGDKQLVFKFKKRKGYKRTKGHRQQLTKIAIVDVNGQTAEPPAIVTASDEPVEAPAAEEPAVEEPTAEAPAVVEEPAVTPEPVEEPEAEEEPAAEEPAVEPEAEEPAAAEEPQDLSKLTVAQLKELAKERGIKLASGARKAQIIETIENAQ